MLVRPGQVLIAGKCLGMRIGPGGMVLTMSQ